MTSEAKNVSYSHKESRYSGQTTGIYVRPTSKNEDSHQDVVNQSDFSRLNGLIVIQLGLGLQLFFVKYGRNHHNIYSVSFN